MPFLLVDAQVIQTLRSTPPSLFNSFILTIYSLSLRCRSRIPSPPKATAADFRAQNIIPMQQCVENLR